MAPEHIVQFSKLVLSWLGYVLPLVTNYILILLGILLSLPELGKRVETKLEESAKARLTLGLACILIGLFEVGYGVHQKRHDDEQIKTLADNANTAASNTTDLISKVTPMVTQVGLLGPQLSVYNSELADFRAQWKAAEGNPQRQAALKARYEAAQEKNTRELLVSIARGTGNTLDTLGEEWWDKEGDIIDQLSMSRMEAKDEAARAKAQVDSNQAHTRLNDQYNALVKPLMISGDEVRGRLLEELGVDASNETLRDKQEAASFTKVVAGESTSPNEVRFAGQYLRDLSIKLSSK